MAPGTTDHILVSHQPAYLPWPGYFARLTDVRRFLLLDHVQFSPGSWQQRNYVADASGYRHLLTVPVRHQHPQPIAQVRIAGDRWRQRHWQTITQACRRAPFWPQWEPRLAAVYDRPWELLADLNAALIELLLDGFGIRLELVRSSALGPAGRKTEMLTELCQLTGTRTLRVGTGATHYLDHAHLVQAEVDVEVATYAELPYDQGRAGFTGGLSALDLLLHCGPDARQVLTAGAGVHPWRPTAVDD